MYEIRPCQEMEGNLVDEKIFKLSLYCDDVTLFGIQTRPK